MSHRSSIPNNVGLDDDPRLQRTLAAWLPGYRDWWRDMTPPEFRDSEVLLRTATSAGTNGWGHYDYVRLPEYRWGIFLAPPVVGRTIGFGDHLGEPVWQDSPPRYEELIRRLLVTQADTESASVEQQRHLSGTAPSLYDLRNLFQVNVDEARHVWALVYLFCHQFGVEGVAEAEQLLARRSGDRERPRLLHAFNQPIADWLDFFMFTMFTDRVGKFQLQALSVSGLDLLARTSQFMLTEEMHHLFVGESGIGRVVRRTCELMRDAETTDSWVVAARGGLPLPLLQRRINLWFSLAEDLFGSEVSRNVAAYFGAGLKGRIREAAYEDHRLLDGTVVIVAPSAGGLTPTPVPPRMTLNEVQRGEFIADCQRAVRRWNRIIGETLGPAGEPLFLRLPARNFNRRIGVYSMDAGHRFDPEGRPISAGAFAASRDDWLPTSADYAHTASVMRQVLAPGAFAGWLSPPARGVHGLPVAHPYVRA